MNQQANFSIKSNMVEQGTAEWFKLRLGNFTGSRIGDLMSGGKKGDMFGKTALAYIYEVASERDLIKSYLDDPYLFEIYINQVSVSNKHIEWGRENEEFAAEQYAKITGADLELCSSIPHPTIPFFSASPDRIATDGFEKRIVEIKSPLPKTFMLYRAEVYDNNSLRIANQNYFYQVQAEMACTGLEKADFVAFCPFLNHPLHIVTIYRDDAVISEFEKRINEANKLIDSILGKIKSNTTL